MRRWCAWKPTARAARTVHSHAAGPSQGGINQRRDARGADGGREATARNATQSKPKF